MRIQDGVRRLLAAYPSIYLACHQEHRRDPATRATLSEHQARILDHLDAAAATTLVTLAEHLGVTPSTMSLHIDRLQAAGYVTRRRDAADRRRVHLQLTAAGVRMQRAGSVLEPTRVAALLARLPAGGRRAGIEGLETLAGAARAVLATHSRSRSWAARRRRPPADPAPAP